MEGRIDLKKGRKQVINRKAETFFCVRGWSDLKAGLVTDSSGGRIIAGCASGWCRKIVGARVGIGLDIEPTKVQWVGRR